MSNRTPRCQRLHISWTFAIFVTALSACTTHAPHVAENLPAPAKWSAPAAPDAKDWPVHELWWTRLNDEAINILIASAVANNPTLQQAIARMEEADASLGMSAAQHLPALQANLGASRTRSVDGGQVSYTSAGVGGLALNWEIDLFGRVGSTVESARFRLDARHADAENARLSLAARVADTTLALRGCQFAKAVLHDDVESRTVTLDLTRRKLSVGALASVDEARAKSSLAGARTLLASREQQCSRHLNALVALSGIEMDNIQALINAPLVPEALPQSSQRPQAILPRYAQWLMPAAPPYQLALPAVVLARHPGVRAAEAELASAWAEIGVAHAERLPRLNLGAALSGQWLRAGGNSHTEGERLWSLAPSISVPLFDNGRGAANVSASHARYRQALATLNGTVRDAARDIENALAAQRSAKARFDTTREAADAAQTVFDSTYAMWQAGATSLFVLEDTRRLLASAQNEAVSVAQEASQAWIALVLACGHSPAYL